jgi:5-methylcytosine-specific restriction endonuclease McrA
VVRQVSGARWLCRCSCDAGTEATHYASSLSGGKTISCGCLRREAAPAVGDVRGEWTILRWAGPPSREAYCQCSCGTKKWVNVYSLGKTSNSCGHSRPAGTGNSGGGASQRPARKQAPSVGPGEKWCRKCEEVKPLEEFHRNTRSKDGHVNRCKRCVKAADDAVRDVRNERARQRYQDDPESKKAKTRAYHLAHPEWSRERLRASHVKHAEVRAERHKERGKDPAIRAARRSASRRSESRRRALLRLPEADHITQVEIDNLVDDYGNRCWICGDAFDDEIVELQIDHYEPLAAGGAHTLDNLRPACSDCNVRKNGRWPLTEAMLAEIRTVVRRLHQTRAATRS